MIAVDTNLLVYAFNSSSPFHTAALAAIHGLIDARRAWVIPWPCVHEFVAIGSHPKIHPKAPPAGQLLDALFRLVSSARATVIGESTRHAETLARLLQSSEVRGGLVHDARIAAICIDHCVEELWSADRDFSRFPDLKLRNPLLPIDGPIP